MVYDPGWDMPRINWQQQGSYETGIVPLVVAPDEGPLVCLPMVNQHWLPLILGCLDQLRNPSTWLASDDNAMSAVLAKSQRLMQMIGDRSECVCTLVRLDSCQLQTSCDGGSTWTTVPGWDPGFAECVQEQIPVIGLPPNPGGEDPTQFACTIAGYLADDIIRKALSQAISSITDDIALLGFGTLIVDLIPEFVLVTAAYNALTIIYTAISEGTIADYEAAIADTALWIEVRCAIYGCIVADGYVKPGNFACIVSAIEGISYVHADVISTIVDFLNSLGATGLAQLSQRAGLAPGADCSDCTGLWCYTWDGPTNLGDTSGWSFDYEGFGALGSYVPGVGFVADLFGSMSETCELHMRWNWGFPVTVDSVEVVYTASTDSGVGARDVVSNTFSHGLNHATGTFDDTLTGATGATIITLRLDSGTTAMGQRNIISRIVMHGHGENPFGPSNC